MKKFVGNKEAVSPMIGVFILVGLMVIMLLAVTVLVSEFTVNLPESATQANIVVVGAKGGLLNDTPPVDFNENWIILQHKMGYPLNTSRTKIQMKGYGETQADKYGTTWLSVKGNILVEYTNLEYDGKLESKSNQDRGDYSPEYHGYGFHNPDLSDSLWSQGEKLTLNGQDSKVPGAASTVKVYMDSVSKTDNNWRFSKGGQITITVMDIPTNQVIASIQTTVSST